MTIKHLALAHCALALFLSVPLAAQEDETATPQSIVEASAPEEWVEIAPQDLLVMELAPDGNGEARTVVIQLMPAPFSQPWVENIRMLARAHWWDGTSVYRAVDNWVVQWGDVSEEKPLPDGIVSPEAEYEADVDTLSSASISTTELRASLSTEGALDLEQLSDPKLPEQQRLKTLNLILRSLGLSQPAWPTPGEQLAMLSINTTQTRLTEQGWHDRDTNANWVEFWQGWPLANEEDLYWVDDTDNIVPDPGPRRPGPDAFGPPYKIVESSVFWPIHCYGHVGVARDLETTGTGSELYTVIGHAPRQLDRNIAVVGRVIEGMEHLSTLPRGTGDAGVYESRDEDTPIVSVRLASELPDAETWHYQYLSTDSESFAAYVAVRANRNDAFYTVPAGGVDICNVQVPIRWIDPEE